MVLLESDRDGVLTVRHISAWAGMQYTEQIGRIRALARSFKIVAGAADRTGVGEPVLEQLRETIPYVEGVTFTMETKLQLASTLKMLSADTYDKAKGKKTRSKIRLQPELSLQGM